MQLHSDSRNTPTLRSLARQDSWSAYPSNLEDLDINLVALTFSLAGFLSDVSIIRCH